MARYKIEHNFKVKRSDVKSYVLVCFSDECGWSMKASARKNLEVFKVRSFNSEHTCPLRERMLTKVQTTVGFVSGVTAPNLRNHKRKHIPKDVIKDVRVDYGVDISYQAAWRAKERALEMLRGKPVEGYRQIPRYIYMLNKVYLNSYIRMC